MTICQYIKSKQEFHKVPFADVFIIIRQLMRDGYVDKNAFKEWEHNVAVYEQKPHE